MTGSEIFDSFFGIHRLYPNELGEALRRYGYLASNPYRSSAEEKELQGLLKQLKQGGVEPGWTPTPRQSSPEQAPRKTARPSKKATKKPSAAKRATRKKR